MVSTQDHPHCERCDYLLRGLRPDGTCPECGLSIEASSAAQKRRRPALGRGDRIIATAGMTLSCVLLAASLGTIYLPKPIGTPRIRPDWVLYWELHSRLMIVAPIAIAAYLVLLVVRRPLRNRLWIWFGLAQLVGAVTMLWFLA